MPTAPRSVPLDVVSAFAAAAEGFADSLARADLRAPVAACPGWTGRDVAVHLGNVHAWAATIVETGRAAPWPDEEPRSSRPRALTEWYVGRAEDLFAVLRGADPEAACWNFATGQGSAGFWLRRQLHETLVHHADLVGGGDPAPSPATAADGVDEALTVMLPLMHRRRHPAALDRPLTLAATDSGDGWLLTPSDGPGEAPEVTRDAGFGAEDRLEGPAAVLQRLLWHRPGGPEDVVVVGDHERVAAFLASRLTP